MVKTQNKFGGIIFIRIFAPNQSNKQTMANLYKPTDFKTLTYQTIRAILERNIMQGRLEHGEYRFWLSEFISLPYGSNLDKPYLCSYIREICWNNELKCSSAPIEPTMQLLSVRLDELASAIYKVHKILCAE